jgi:hypothetical protein
MEKAAAIRLDEVLTKRLTATTLAVGDTFLPILNQFLGTFRELSDAIGKIPCLDKMIARGTMLASAASARPDHSLHDRLAFVAQIPFIRIIVTLFSVPRESLLIKSKK